MSTTQAVTTATADIVVTHHGSIIGFAPASDAGEAWLTEHLADAQCLGKVRHCEPRYAQDIIDGAQGDGLTVTHSDTLAYRKPNAEVE
jgi:hypothetical protein